MKFSLFVHMERYDQDVSHRELFEQLTELTLLAEAGGFSTVWVGEHHAMEYTISPSPMPILSYLAARTSTIRLGAGTIIAPFWNPIRVAGECALLDVISNGRMEVGLARGAYQFEFDRMAGGMPATDGGKALREMVPVVRKLWEGDYAHDGEVYKFPTSTSVPKPYNVVVYKYEQSGGQARLSDIYDTTPATAASTTAVASYAHHTHLEYEDRTDPTQSYNSGGEINRSRQHF